MSKHTPGPWEVTEADADSARVSSADYGTIAFLHDPLASEMGRKGEIYANARLVAAGPELLEALKAVVSVADRATQEFDMARAAIAKAEAA